MKSCLGQGIPVAAVRRQSNWGKFTESQHSSLPFSTRSLEGVVWISETQRKYSWLFLHIHNYRHNPGDPTTHTKQKKLNQERRRVSNITSAFSNTEVRIYHFSRSSELKNQDTATNSTIQQLCLDGKSAWSPCCMEMAGCVLFYCQHISCFVNSFISSAIHPAWGFLLLVIYPGKSSSTTYILEAIYITIHTCAL